MSVSTSPKDLKDRLDECLRLRCELQELGVQCPETLKKEMKNYVRDNASSSGCVPIEGTEYYAHYQLSTKTPHTYLRLSKSAVSKSAH